MRHNEGMVKIKRRVGPNATENVGRTATITVVLEPED